MAEQYRLLTFLLVGVVGCGSGFVEPEETIRTSRADPPAPVFTIASPRSGEKFAGGEAVLCDLTLSFTDDYSVTGNGVVVEYLGRVGGKDVLFGSHYLEMSLEPSAKEGMEILRYSGPLEGAPRRPGKYKVRFNAVGLEPLQPPSESETKRSNLLSRTIDIEIQ